jgi:hypothetical protein
MYVLDCMYTEYPSVTGNLKEYQEMCGLIMPLCVFLFHEIRSQEPPSKLEFSHCCQGDWSGEVLICADDAGAFPGWRGAPQC